MSSLVRNYKQQLQLTACEVTTQRGMPEISLTGTITSQPRIINKTTDPVLMRGSHYVTYIKVPWYYNRRYGIEFNRIW